MKIATTLSTSSTPMIIGVRRLVNAAPHSGPQQDAPRGSPPSSRTRASPSSRKLLPVSSCHRLSIPDTERSTPDVAIVSKRLRLRNVAVALRLALRVDPEADVHEARIVVRVRCDQM